MILKKLNLFKNDAMDAASHFIYVLVIVLMFFSRHSTILSGSNSIP